MFYIICKEGCHCLFDVFDEIKTIMPLSRNLIKVNSNGEVFEQNSAALVFFPIEEFWAGSGFPLTAFLHIVPDEVRWTGNVIIENPVVASGIDVAPVT